ncbi:EGF region [Fasciola gigantica]|uniref:EGF region n=1 Tax=Fasciola gigantica TaxID=46835 RepID=A0A504YKB4_FASGI|nr:EGF region [Fasciola gigantica]
MILCLLCIVCFIVCNTHATSLPNLARFPMKQFDSNPDYVHETMLTRGERQAPVQQIEHNTHGQTDTANSATTLAFIEVIVKRTVNQYMKVIRTQPDWFERLLQLVREELNIRSKYNCSTDACIYKIQLFTHYLHSHLMGTRTRVRKRIRRSSDLQAPNAEMDNLQPSEISRDLFQVSAQSNVQLVDFPNGEIQVTSNPTTFEPIALRSDLTESAPQAVDDALRLPEIPLTPKLQNSSLTGEALIPVIENDSSRTRAAHFGTPDKINMARVSQQILSEALSKQQRPIANQMNLEETTDISINSPFTLDTSISKGSAKEGVASINLADSAPSHVDNQSQENGLAEPKTLSLLSNEGDNHPLGIVELPSDAATAIPLSEDIVSTSEAPTLTELTPDEESDNSWNREDSLDNNPRLNVDLSVQAIPFGQNEFVGKPYENCTGRFENYCYNALKCVYISVLETAACYCRTGYTGVRCDMFNLPQTLDILKSFKEEIIDVSSLRQTNAVTLYSVVEATARYTVNAVLEENLISEWDEDSML